jgi:hypothetical protein
MNLLLYATLDCNGNAGERSVLSPKGRVRKTCALRNGLHNVRCIPIARERIDKQISATYAYATIGHPLLGNSCKYASLARDDGVFCGIRAEGL